MTPRTILASLLRAIANYLDPQHKTRFLRIDHHRFAMRDDLPFKIPVD